MDGRAIVMEDLDLLVSVLRRKLFRLYGGFGECSLGSRRVKWYSILVLGYSYRTPLEVIIFQIFGDEWQRD